MQVQDLTEKTWQGKHASFFAAALVTKKKKFYEIGTWGGFKIEVNISFALQSFGGYY